MIVQAKAIARSYQMGKETVTALKQVDLLVKKQEMVAIMGPSGSGKSTLMHILGCLERPQKGSYFLNGKDTSDLNDTELSFLRATQIGFIFQSFNLIPYLTVFDNVALPFHYSQKEKVMESILNSIERVGLSHRLHHLPKELSGGEMQRVAIARALAIHPLLILADEPTGNLDGANRAGILELLQSLNLLETTIVIVTHDDEVAKHCTRLVQMKDGLIVNDQRI